VGRDASTILGRKGRSTLGAARPGSEVEGGCARFELAQLIDCLHTLAGESEVADRLGSHRVAEASKHQLSLARDLAGHEPAGDIEAVWLEWRERLGPPEPGIVCHSRRRGELSRAVRAEHQDTDAEARAPAQRVKADRAGCVQDHEAAKAMRGPVIATGAPVGTHTVVNFEGTTLDHDPHAKAVGDTDAGRVGTGIGLGERRHGVGDILGGEVPRLGCARR